MLQKIVLASLMLILMPALACAGWIFPSVITGASTGSISPATQVKASAPYTFTLTSASGYTINYATVDYGNTKLPVTSIGSNQWTVTVPLTAANQFLYVYFSSGSGTQSMTLVANAGPSPKNTQMATPLGLSGAASTVAFLPPGTNATYEWSASPGTGVTFSSPTGIANTPSNIYTTFTAATAGSYNVTLKLTAGSTTSSATISIIAQTSNAAASSSCSGCHNTLGVFYSSSRHAASNSGPACQGCHTMSTALPHPGVQPTNATCTACHSSIPRHSAAANDCSLCHDAHSASSTHPTSAARPDCATCHETRTLAAPHYGGTAFLEAQYVSDASLPVSCSNCHGGLANTAANRAILAQYTSSAHGSPLADAWRHYDWRSSTRASCQRCHAGTAFVAKLGNENNTTNAYQPTDVIKPGEVLNCSACHTDAGTGALRTAARQFTINLSNGATVTYDVAGASTLCARCHSGRETGNSIKADTDADGIRGFIDSHYLVAAATVYNKGGYEYAGQDYASLGSHKYVGTGSQGPCVACHMGIGTANHTWNVANSNACGNCHSNPTAAKLAEAKASYQAALDSLRLALQAKGIYYDASHPYFFTAPYDPNNAVYNPANPTAANTPFTNWAGVYGLSSWKDVMGAAFNYRMLVNDPGAYAHNKQYALKLIADSCDFLADSAVDGQGIPVAVTTAIKSVKFGLK